MLFASLWRVEFHYNNDVRLSSKIKYKTVLAVIYSIYAMKYVQAVQIVKLHFLAIKL